MNNILKRKLEYIQRYEENENELQYRKIHKTNNIDINQAILEWFKKMRGINALISRPMLKEEALDFAKKFGLERFSASNGCLESFKKNLVWHSHNFLLPCITLEEYFIIL